MPPKSKAAKAKDAKAKAAKAASTAGPSTNGSADAASSSSAADSSDSSSSSSSTANTEKPQVKESYRNCTGVLISQPRALDVKIGGFTLAAYGKELIKDTQIEFTIGRRYGLIGSNGSGKSAFLKCLTGDHSVLTRSGWRSIQHIQRGELVASLNKTTKAMEWKRVTDTQRFPVRGCQLYRMQGEGMDVVATADHRMLCAKVNGSKLTVGNPIGYDTVQELLDFTYYTHEDSHITRFEHSSSRKVLRSGINMAPDHPLVIRGLEAVCTWWWQKDHQVGFLKFLGFWLGDGHLHIQQAVGLGVSQRKLEATAWLIDLLDEVFPSWWYRNATNTDDGGTTFNYIVRCPPLYDWLRAMSVGPVGYNPLDPAALRSYPHFIKDDDLAAHEAQTRYREAGPTPHKRWTQATMLDAFRAGPAQRNCIMCGQAGRCMLTCSGVACRPVDNITCAHFACAKATFEKAWYCPTCSNEESDTETGSSSDSDMSVEGQAELQVEGRVRVDVEVEAEGQVMEVVVENQVVVEVEGQVPAVQVAARVVWNNGEWDIDMDGNWFYLKRWMGPDVASSLANLSQVQATALLEGFCRADGTYASVRFDHAGEPVGAWCCFNSSFPLIDHLQLIGHLAGARVDLARHSEAGASHVLGGRLIEASVDHWELTFNFTKMARSGVSLSPVAKPVNVTKDIKNARGYYDYKDDGFVYDLTIDSVGDINSNFLTQRLSMKRHRGGRGEERNAGGGDDVRAHSVFVGNCLAEREVPIPSHIDIFLLEEEVAAEEKTPTEVVIYEVQEEMKRLESESERVLEEEGPESELLQDIYNRLDGMDPSTFEVRAGKLLHGLGFSQDFMQKKTKDLSGGWRMRVALAKALFIKPTLLLLDEPTNHLDLEACVWLENYLATYDRCLVVISHSQDFLNGVCTNIIHITEKNKLKNYTGNYDMFIQTKAELEVNQMKRYQKEQDDIKHIKAFIASCGTYSNLVRQAKSKQKIIDKMEADGLTEKVEPPPVFNFHFAECEKLPPPILSFENVSFAYSGVMKDCLYQKLNLGVDSDSRIALVGPNGAGKSTLLKLMVGELSATEGAIRKHLHLSIARYNQHSNDQLDPKVNVLDFIRAQFPEKKMEEQEWRSHIGRYGLGGSLQKALIGHLSDGMKSRVVFCMLAIARPNLLLLDEPTNHLDMECIDSLARAIQAFHGGVVLVSHDFRLIDQVAKQIWVCDKKTISIWKGDIRSYKNSLVQKVKKEQESFNI